MTVILGHVLYRANSTLALVNIPLRYVHRSQKTSTSLEMKTTCLDCGCAGRDMFRRIICSELHGNSRAYTCTCVIRSASGHTAIAAALDCVVHHYRSLLSEAPSCCVLIRRDRQVKRGGTPAAVLECGGVFSTWRAGLSSSRVGINKSVHVYHSCVGTYFRGEQTTARNNSSLEPV